MVNHLKKNNKKRHTLVNMVWFG